MNSRIKQLRKSEGLTQRDFGGRIHLSQNHLSSLEKGIREITERTIDDICKEFGVNKEWLKNGVGDMYIDPLEKFKIEDSEVEEYVRMFLQLDPETRKHIAGLMKKTLEK